MTETREEWLEGRRKGIGGSDWEDILSIEPYGCERRCWYSKTGSEPDYPDQDSGVLKRGRKLEPLVFEEFEETQGRPVDACPQGEDASRWFEENYGMADEIIPGVPRPDWWIGTPDGVLVKTDEPTHGNFEAKTSGPWVYAKILKEGIPERTLAQRQHYLGLSGFDWGVVAYLEPATWSFLPLPYTRDNSLLASMLHVGRKFWNKVEKKEEPERLEMGDSRCRNCQFHITCWGAIVDDGASSAVASKDYTALDDRVLCQLYDASVEARKIVKLAEEEKEATDIKVWEYLGSFDGGSLADWEKGKVLKLALECGKLRVSDGKYTRVDMKEFAAAYPRLDAAIKEKFKRTKQGSPSLYFYPKKKGD